VVIYRLTFIDAQDFSMIEAIEDLILETDKMISYLTSSKDSYSPAVLDLLPDVKTGLEYIRDNLANKPPNIRRARQGVSGLGRVAMEYTEFYESDLGKRVLELNNKLRKKLDQLYENLVDKEGYSKLREFE